MTSNILITGGNSDIGSKLIGLIYKNNDLNIYSTRYSGTSIKDKVYKEYSIDFSNPNSELVDDLPSLDISHLILIHGTILRDSLLENDSLYDVMQINMFSSLEIIKKILPGMIGKKFGRIVAVNTASLKIGGGKNSYSYGLSKSALKYTVKHLSKHYSEFNILTNSISPGFVDTKFHNKSKTKEEIDNRIQSLNNPSTTKEISEMIYFLMFKNDSITGQDIVIDGGEFT